MINEYLKKRYKERRQEAIKFLGGSCVKCGSEENLELDHIDPTSKDFDVSRFWGTTLKRFWNEVEKCQLLCNSCHIKKTVEERGQQLAKGTHGTFTSYKYCHCEICRKAIRGHRRRYMQEYRQKRAIS